MVVIDFVNHYCRSRSSSESEDSDDPFAWISQRKQIKGALKHTPHPTTPPHHNLHQYQKIPKSLSSMDEQTRVKPDLQVHLPSLFEQNGSVPYKETTQEATIPPHPPIHSHRDKASLEDTCTKNAVLVSEDTKKSVLVDREERVQTSQGILHVSSCSSLSEEEASTTSAAKDFILTESKGIEVHRQRSTDSLTLSSSFSENETLTSEVVTDNKDKHREEPSNISKPPPSPTKSKKALKRKSKKAKKKEKAKEESKRKKRTQRTRTDSLTTSSDEDNSSSGVEIISSTSTEKSVEENGEVVIDEEKLKLHLLKRIQSKKPPSHFVTPATDPIFHEVSPDSTKVVTCTCTIVSMFHYCSTTVHVRTSV